MMSRHCGIAMTAWRRNAVSIETMVQRAIAISTALARCRTHRAGRYALKQ
ncbi:hypothetical protein JOE11_005246 [Robbsia andropogonis]|nr:hypothetical protein [Robbsia andropogonis]